MAPEITYYKQLQEHLDKLEELNRALEKQSQTDVLTTIFNRRFFNMQLAKEAARSTRHRTPLSVLMFDIDHFKEVNDEHGHLAGDKVLQEISALVQDNIRQSDFLARWGGEEFALLTPGVGLKNAAKFAEKLRNLIEQHDFSLGQVITCSFGVSCYQASEEISTATPDATIAATAIAVGSFFPQSQQAFGNYDRILESESLVAPDPFRSRATVMTDTKSCNCEARARSSSLDPE